MFMMKIKNDKFEKFNVDFSYYRTKDQFRTKLYEMENSLNSQCKQLLNRVQTSNLSSFLPKTRIKQVNESRLQSLSLKRRKLNQSLKRQFSLATGMDKMLDTQEKFSHSQQKEGPLKEMQQSLQPQFNLRKGTKVPVDCNYSTFGRKPFANVTNVNKLKLTLQRRENKDYNEPDSYIKHRAKKIGESLQVNPLVGRYSPTMTPSNQGYQFGSSEHYQHRQADNAVQNANTVNDIFNFIKNKSHSENQEIGEFTQIIFKLVCYFFVSFISEQNIKVKFNENKMMDFVQRQMAQSYNALSSFKKSKKEAFSKADVSSNSSIFSGNPGGDNQSNPHFVRRDKKVSSFFKAVEPSLQYDHLSQGSDSPIASVRKFNRNMAKQDEVDDNNQPRQINNLKIPRLSQPRRLSIALNAVRQDNREQSSQKSLSNTTERQNTSKEQIFNEPVQKPHFRTSKTQRKSFFMTEMNGHDLKMRKSFSGVVLKEQQSQSQIIKKSPTTSKNCLKSQFDSQTQIQQNMGSNSGFSNSKLQNLSSHNTLHSKQKINSKVNLNLSTPYDFLKEDNLMAKRRKYLELHQKITEMTDNCEELKKEEQQLSEKIEVKDGQLIDMENKLLQISKEVELYEARTKQAEEFLNGTQCPQMVQKIIKKNTEIKKNLTGLINSHAWESSNLAQSSHVHHIMSTKQSSLDKLNAVTRKLRGCKNLEEIEGLIGQMREIFLITIEKYSEIIDEFQDKIRQSEGERSNMLKNLEDWEIQTKLKQKLLNNSFLDYYSVQRRVSTYIQKLPQSLKKLQQYIYILSQQRKPDYVVGSAPGNQSKSDLNRPNIEEIQMNDHSLKRIMIIEKEIMGYLEKMIHENGIMATQLPKQKKFAMVLQKIV